MVEGTAEMAGDRLRVSLRLPDVHSGRLVWAEAFEGSPAERAVIAQSASARIGASLGAKL